MEFFQKTSGFSRGTRFAPYARLTSTCPDVWRYVGTISSTATGPQVEWARGTAAVAAAWPSAAPSGAGREVALGYIEFGVARDGKWPVCIARRPLTADIVRRSRQSDAGHHPARGRSLGGGPRPYRSSGPA